MHKTFHLAQWHVDPNLNCLSDGQEKQQLEPRAMDVLRALCERHGQVVSSEQLLEQCWGEAAGGDNPLHKAITQLRRALGDSSASPRFIETIRKRGYRLIAPLVHGGEARPDSWKSGSPFRGLEAFDERHASVFYGRGRAAAALLDVLAAQARAGSPMVLVLGPSGSGKTSLIRAGLLPQLTAPDADPALASCCALYLDCGDVDAGGLFLALGSVMLDAEADGLPLFGGDSGATLGQRLEREPGAVAAALRGLGARRLALCIDRFEAIYRLPPSQERERLRFIEVLEELVRSGAVVLVMACRNDFYPQLTATPALMALKLRGGHFDLNAPTRDEIAQIVRHPATAAQLHFGADPASGAGLDEILCDAATGSPDCLPLLQYCLQELYRTRAADNELRFAAYADMGGLEGAIGARAELVVSGLTEQQAGALPRVLSQLVSVARDDVAVTSRRGAWAALQGEAEQELVRALVEARLFVSDLVDETSTFAIAHEAVLRCWPRALAWIETHRHALQLRASVADQAARWQAGGCARDLLLPRGSQVRQAADLLDMADITVSGQERRFVQASLKRARLGERVRLLVTGVLVALAVLATGLGLAARQLQQQAEQHRTEAEGLMAFMLGDFVERLRLLGRLDLLDSVSTRALGYLSASRTDGDAPQALAQRAKALQVIAEVKIARADPAAAVTALRASQDILQQQLGAAGEDKAILKLMGGNAFWLGQVFLDQRDWLQSEQYFRQYVAFSERQAAADRADTDGLIEQSYAHSSLGSLLLLRGDIARAAAEFVFSVDLKTRILAQSPRNIKLQADLANSVSWLASAQAQLGKLAEAMALYEQEMTLIGPLHDAEPGNALWSERLAFAVWRQADLRLALGQPKRAEAGLLAAHQLLGGVVARDASNRTSQSALYTVQLRLLELRADTAGPQATLAGLRVLKEGLRGLSRLEPKKKNLLRLIAVTEQDEAAALYRLGRPAQAAPLLANALATLASLHADLPDDQGMLESLADALLVRAAHEPAAAQQSCQQAAAALAPAIRENTDYKLLVPLVKARQCLGQNAIVKKLQSKLNDIGYANEVLVQRTPPGE